MRLFITIPDNVNTDMVPPSKIVDTFDPDGNGWNGMFPLRNNEFAQIGPLDLEVLIQQTEKTW
jgi:hypothetical protein